MTFSRADSVKKVQKHLVRQAITQAKNGDAEFRIKHNDEFLDVQKKNYVKITARINKEVQETYTKAMDRRNHHAGN